MQTKLQELTEKIYQEGVNKAKDEAEKLKAAAQKEADDLVSDAKKQAEGIMKDAEKQAEELKNNAMNELQLSARQLISDTRQKVVNLIETKVVEPEVKATFKDVEFTQKVIHTLVENWNPKGDERVEISVLLPKEKQKEFEAFFKGKTAEMLGKGAEISFSDKIKGGFKIGPKKGGYLISFSDEDFDNLFRGYLRPRLIEMLFDIEKE
ncbi:MAG: V-type ATP synthase subunit E [Bacteroidetes bacterium]|nr:MAG: V-type ATP synthase subunit E [Bacteroidota bacterium]